MQDWAPAWVAGLLPVGRRAATSGPMLDILLILNTCVAVALVIIVLLQKTDPAAGGMFGGAGSSTHTVVRNPLARPTAWLAGMFLVLSLALAVLAKGGGHGAVSNSVMANAVLPPHPALVAGMAPVTPTVPVLPSPTVSNTAVPGPAVPGVSVITPTQG
jgi:preprotein translocase subunit SecG